MKYSSRVFNMLLIVICAAVTVSADEGMWPLYMLDKLHWDSLTAMGLQLKPNDIYNAEGTGLASAVLQVGATGSFVSPNGLLLTNHHVAFGAIQEQSTLEHNYVRDGFYAATFKEELPALGYKASATVSIEDVTKRIMSVVKPGMSDLKRYEAIDLETKKLIREVESRGDVKARVARMYEGKQYMLYTMVELRDIRIVYVPPEAIGNYGGDIDNWMWPRHTGDFSFLRAYVGPDGRPAAFAPENVPYHPKAYLSVSTEGIKEGDFAMTLGFPGRTSRYVSSFELANQINFYYPNAIKTSEDQIRIIGDAGKADSAIELRMSSRMQGLNNSLKKSYGILEGFRKRDVLAYKRDQEQQLRNYLAANPKLQKQYGGLLTAIDSLCKAREAYQQRDFMLGRMAYGSDYLRLASTLYRWACERKKPDLERERGYQDRDIPAAKERLQNAQINLVPEVDKLVFKYFLGRVLALPQDQRVPAIDKLAEGHLADPGYIDGLVDRMYAASKVGDSSARLNMFAMDQKDIELTNDPFIDLAKALKPEIDAQMKRSKTFDGALTRLAPLLIMAYADWRKDEMYPDANGTMRLSYGQVKGYSPSDATTYFYETGIKGVMQKETGQDPFIVPAKLAQTYTTGNMNGYLDPAINDVPVDFITTNDITGGNSGSPVINGKGKMIGIAFDGNWEGVASDYLFNPPVTRTIAVDMRYIVYLIDKVYAYKGLLSELGIQTGTL
ncbi:MAG: S46 family peptidase [candidate division Zixibacteria bacterium]|nr:S46 family peptidase [candidate division Zixibacteria bacterium]